MTKNEGNALTLETIRPPSIALFVVVTLVTVVVAIASIVGLSRLIVDLRMAEVAIPTVSAADETTLSESPVPCAFGGTRDTLVLLDCASGQRAARVLAIRPVLGIPGADARSGIAAGLSEYAHLSEGFAPTCNLWMLEQGPTAACNGGDIPDLETFLVANGYASAATTDLLPFEDIAREARLGLHADVAAQKSQDILSIQNWLSTALAVIGGAAIFLYTRVNTGRAWEDRKKRVRRQLGELLGECLAAKAEWGDDPNNETEQFKDRLKSLRDFLDRERAAGEWGATTLEEIDKLRRRISPEADTGTISDDWHDIVTKMNKAISEK